MTLSPETIFTASAARLSADKAVLGFDGDLATLVALSSDGTGAPIIRLVCTSDGS